MSGTELEEAVATGVVEEAQKCSDWDGEGARAKRVKDVPARGNVEPRAGVAGSVSEGHMLGGSGPVL